jgi:hypothetical protein
MYLKRVHIQRMKRIRDLTLELPDVDGEPRRWTVIIGENGTAKTSILQAIALAAAGSSQVNAVMDRGVKLMRDRRTEDEPLKVSADFVFTPGAHDRALHPLAPADTDLPPGLTSTVTLAPGSTSFSARARYAEPAGEVPGEDPLVHAREFHTRQWFVAGYGVARALPDSGWTPDLDNRSVERLKPIFDHRFQLASVGIANSLLKEDHKVGDRPGTRARRLSKVLNQILKVGGDALMPGVRGLELRGAGGTRTTADLIDSDRFKMRAGAVETTIAGAALSHGFQSTFAWIADLVGHILLEADAQVTAAEMEGLVLIDEIDLYLHPSWQASFVRALRRVFPRLQFIVTTHSPVVLAGLTPDEIVRLGSDPQTGDIRQVARHPVTGELTPIDELGGPAAEPDPRAMTGTEVYEDYFGIDRLTLHPAGEAYRDYLALSGDPLRSAAQDREVRALRRALMAAGLTDIPEPAPREMP